MGEIKKHEGHFDIKNKHSYANHRKTMIVHNKTWKGILNRWSIIEWTMLEKYWLTRSPEGADN